METDVKLFIQALIKEGKIRLVWSYTLDFENSQNPFEEKMLRIHKWRCMAIEDIEENSTIIATAKQLHDLGIRKMDALHIACAIQAIRDCFITTDKGILKKAKSIKQIQICDPIDFIQRFDHAD
ncbi:MAG: PIN domain protein [candidate division KSB1 bacterium]|nr:PIN domain protein [candidate division KSB1 bacterium]